MTRDDMAESLVSNIEIINENEGSENSSTYNEYWIWFNVKGLQATASALIAQIIDDHNEENEIDKTAVSWSFFNAQEQAHRNLSKENGNFIWFQLFIEPLLRMRSVDIETSLDEYVSMCKLQYKGNLRQLKTIEEFQQTYDAEHCLWWYSKEVFLYSILNRALRAGDIDTLYTFRFIIRDLYQTLQENKQFNQPILELYRGQALSVDELSRIEASIGQYISMNSFFSTSIKRPVALLFAQSTDTISSNLKPVLFHTRVNTQPPDTKPFGDVQKFSHFGEVESEILFLLGSVFRTQGIRFQNDEPVHIVDLELCGEQEIELKDLYIRMRTGIGEETNIKILGNVLKDMGLHNKALKYYQNLLKQLKQNDSSIQSCCYGIGQVKQLQGDYDGSLSYFQMVLGLESKFPSKDKIMPGFTHNYIGIAYHYGKNFDYSRALEHYRQAFDIHPKVKDREFIGTAYVYQNLATPYRALEDYDKSLQYHHECLNVKKELFGTEQDWSIAASYNNIGRVYHYKTDFRLALEYYKKASEIRLKTLPENHHDIAASFYNIAKVQKSLKDYRSAMEFSQRSLDLYTKAFGESYPLVIDLKEK
ncbi:unnamed protein product [Rotaria socialis]|uniref:Uncharacterized protein n=2 Tax=Rotaria socialis TaxID=392032 RepID=A0A820F379_9BILA|nr:unnamed protein product [Rotaria socialis]